ncbi:MAG: 30S ribosomal protein S3ae [Promethearchaeota archaeon]
MSPKARKKKDSFKEKNWYQVIAPKNFKNKIIGEIIGLDNNVIGRVIETSLYDFTESFKDINLKLKFKVVSINEEASTCQTIFSGHAYSNDFIRALIGRGTSKVQTILNLTTKDQYVFRITTICTTIKRARSSQQILIRKIMSEILKKFAKSLNHEKFVKGMIYGEFQHQVQRIAKTIYPLSSSTVVKSKLISVPEGGEDKEVPDDQFDIIDVEVKRSRKSEIRRTERINVKKLAQKTVKKADNVSKSEELEVEEEEDTSDEDLM